MLIVSRPELAGDPEAAGGACCSDCGQTSARKSAGAALILGALRRPTTVAQLGELGDPLIWTPGAITDLVNQVNQEITTLAGDFRAALDDGRVSELQAKSFRGFLADWVQYRDNVGFLGTLTGATVERARVYQTTALQWRKLLEGAGATVTGPAPGAPPEGVPGWLKWAGGAAIAIAGAYAVGKVAMVAGLFGPRRATA